MRQDSVKNFPPRLPIFFQNSVVNITTSSPVSTQVPPISDKVTEDKIEAHPRGQEELGKLVIYQKNAVVRGGFS
jgi:hypothetical protein